MIGKPWNNQYCYSRLILAFNSIKITKIKIMRSETDKRKNNTSKKEKY